MGSFWAIPQRQFAFRLYCIPTVWSQGSCWSVFRANAFRRHARHAVVCRFDFDLSLWPLLLLKTSRIWWFLLALLGNGNLGRRVANRFQVSMHFFISVSLLVRAGVPRGVAPSNGGLSLFPRPGNVGVRSGQQEAYAKVICQDLLNY